MKYGFLRRYSLSRLKIVVGSFLDIKVTASVQWQSHVDCISSNYFKNTHTHTRNTL